MTKFLTANFVFTVLMVNSASANADPCSLAGATCSAVPEISALEGTAALAALAAMVLIAWERRRRVAA